MFDFCDVTGTGVVSAHVGGAELECSFSRRADKNGVLRRQRPPPRRRRTGSRMGPAPRQSRVRAGTAELPSRTFCSSRLELSCRGPFHVGGRPAMSLVGGGSAVNPIPRARTQCCSSSAAPLCQEAARTIASFGNQTMRADTVDEPSREAQSASWHVGVGAA
jgi:hypothetical protein